MSHDIFVRYDSGELSTVKRNDSSEVGDGRSLAAEVDMCSTHVVADCNCTVMQWFSLYPFASETPSGEKSRNFDRRVNVNVNVTTIDEVDVEETLK